MQHYFWIVEVSMLSLFTFCPQCNFWQYEDRPKRCTRKTGNTTLLPGINGDIIYIGPNVSFFTVTKRLL